MEHRIRAAGILVDQGAVLLLRVNDFTGEYWIPPGGEMGRALMGPREDRVSVSLE